MPTKITKLTPEQKSRMQEWVDKWIKIGLCTDEADWGTFEKAVAKCYGFSGLEKPKVVVHVNSPMVLAFAAPIADYIIEQVSRGARKKTGNGSAVDSAVDSAVGSAVDSAVYSAVDGAPRSVKDLWKYYFGGQFWVGGWYLSLIHI